MRMRASEFSRRVATWRSTHGKDFVDRWVPAKVTDQAEDDKGCAYLTNLAAPSGQQKFSTMFDKPLQLVRLTRQGPRPPATRASKAAQYRGCAHGLMTFRWRSLGSFDYTAALGLFATGHGWTSRPFERWCVATVRRAAPRRARPSMRR